MRGDHEAAGRIGHQHADIGHVVAHAQGRRPARVAARQRGCQRLGRDGAAGVAARIGVGRPVTGWAQRVARSARNADRKTGARMHRRVVRVEAEALVQRQRGFGASAIGLAVDALGIVQAHARPTGAALCAHPQFAAGAVDGLHKAAAHMQRALRDARDTGDVLVADDVALQFGLERHTRRRRVFQRQAAAALHRASRRAAKQVLRRQVLARHGDQQVARQDHRNAAHRHHGRTQRLRRRIEAEALDVPHQRERRIGRLRQGQAGPQHRGGAKCPTGLPRGGGDGAGAHVVLLIGSPPSRLVTRQRGALPWRRQAPASRVAATTRGGAGGRNAR